MQPLILTSPPEAVAAARLPRQGMEADLQRRLATALYSDGILPGGAACRMAGIRLIISNTSPLINFAEIGCFDSSGR